MEHEQFSKLITNILSRIEILEVEISNGLHLMSSTQPLLEVKKNSELAAYVNAYASEDINPDHVVWESHYGAGMVCNPYAMFKYMISCSDYSHLSHTWIISDDQEISLLENEWKCHSNVTFVKHSSYDYHRLLATSGYIIGNVSLPQFFSKREGQTVVNTWHSITAKTLGYDQVNGRIESRNVVRSFLATDFLISPNRFMSELYINSYKLNGVFDGRILETGFPRTDFSNAQDHAQIVLRLLQRGVKIHPDKKIVLYAPTWRGATVNSANADFPGFQPAIDLMRKGLDPSKYQILIKPHNLMFKAFERNGIDTTQYVPPNVDANELLSVVDVLITDYSSIFYDFLPSGKPIIFYAPDKLEYHSNRGIVIDFESLPGALTDDPKALVELIASDNGGSSSTEKKRYIEQANWSGPWADGNASKRAAEAIFLQKEERTYGFISQNKKKILFYGGALSMNGVTTSFIALLKSLDLSMYDVTVYTPAPKDEIQKRNINSIPEGIRVIVKVGSGTATDIEERKKTDFLYNHNANLSYQDQDVQVFFKREFKRCFGDAVFDFVIDYSGYSLYWPALFAQASGAVSLVWQHNELSKDFNNKEKRKALADNQKSPSLAAIAAMYKHIDVVVACGKEVMEANRAAMALPSTYRKFTYAQNIVEFRRVKKGIKNRYCFRPLNNGNIGQRITALAVDLPFGFRRGAKYTFGDASPFDKTGEKAFNTLIPIPSSSNLNFVTIGRFSSEKNHLALIKAFHRFCQETPKSSLYIIGDGLLYSKYDSLIRKLNLGNHVFLSGNLKNPFGLASLCDCFVLPSIYEGSPLTVLEARAMSMPLILSKFNTVDSVCVSGGQHLVGFTENEIFGGLKAFRDGLVPKAQRFDAKQYNLIGLEQFQRLISSVN